MICVVFSGQYVVWHVQCEVCHVLCPVFIAQYIVCIVQCAVKIPPEDWLGRDRSRGKRSQTDNELGLRGMHSKVLARSCVHLI